MNNLINNKDFKVGMYIRLSREDGDRVESESVGNQRDLIHRYIEENDFNFIDEYVDDGYTGTNFDRPAFKRLLEDIDTKRINMVITKDLSRLGRNYIEVGNYLERIFPEKNVRYLSLLDSIDTYLENNTDIAPFKSVLNDMYSKDISKKIKGVLSTKRKAGEYLGYVAPFGYIKDTDNKNKLIISPYEASLVKRIFDMYVNGKGISEIARTFNDEGILGPAEQMNLYKLKKNSTTFHLWKFSAIKKMLQNEVYLGKIVQGKSKKLNYKSKKIIYLSKEDYVIVSNKHEPIIDKIIFETVQNMMKDKSNSKTVYNEPLLKGLLYCPYCNMPLSIKSRTDKRTKGKTTIRRYLYCKNAYREDSECPKFHITYEKYEPEILNILKTTLEEFLSPKYFDKKRQVEKIKSVNNTIQIIEEQDLKIDTQIENLDRKIRTLYEDRLNNIIEAEDYTCFSKKLNEERKVLLNKKQGNEERKEKLKEQILSNDVIKRVENLINECLDIENITKDVLYKLIFRIEIDKYKKANIYFNFNNKRREAYEESSKLVTEVEHKEDISRNRKLIEDDDEQKAVV